MLLRNAALALFLAICVMAPSNQAQSKGGGNQITPVSITARRDIQFGDFASSLSGPGNVILSPYADSVTSTGSITSFGGTVRRARFQIQGQPNYPVFVYLPSSITIQKNNGQSMTVNSFTMDTQNPVILNNRGRATINVGATLHIGTNQPQGNYRRNNDFTVSVSYQ